MPSVLPQQQKQQLKNKIITLLSAGRTVTCHMLQDKQNYWEPTNRKLVITFGSSILQLGTAFFLLRVVRRSLSRPVLDRARQVFSIREPDGAISKWPQARSLEKTLWRVKIVGSEPLFCWTNCSLNQYYICKLLLSTTFILLIHYVNEMCTATGVRLLPKPPALTDRLTPDSRQIQT